MQENNNSFLLDINEEEGIIARVSFSTIVQDTGFVTGYIAAKANSSSRSKTLSML